MNRRPADEEADTIRREMLDSMMAAGVALSGFPFLARGEVPGRLTPHATLDMIAIAGAHLIGHDLGQALNAGARPFSLPGTAHRGAFAGG